MQKKIWSIMDFSQYIWLILTIIAFVFLFSGINHEGIWCDEAFSYAMVRHNFIWIIIYTFYDVHPPLYYLILKLFVMVFGTSTIALRFLSIIGSISMLWLGAGPIRRLLGQKTALIFAGLMIILPATLIYSHEVRMYTWANFFTLAGIIYGYSSIMTNKKKDWILFAFFSLAGMYTHYYSLVAIFLGHVIIFIYILIKSRNKIKPYFITAGIILLLYLPWIFIFVNQAISVTKGFWIPTIGFESVLNAIIMPFGTKLENGNLTIITKASSFLSIIIIIYGIIEFIKKKNNEKTKATILFISIFFLVIVFAILFSLFITPVLDSHYISVCSGLFLLSVALCINALKKFFIRIFVLIMLIILILTVDIFILTQKFNGPGREVAAEIKQKIQPEDILLTSEYNSFLPLLYYLPKANHVFLKNRLPEADPKFFKSDIQNIENLSEIIGKKKQIWIINISRYFNNEFFFINSNALIQAGYDEKYHITEYDYPYSWLNLQGAYYVLPDNIKK